MSLTRFDTNNGFGQLELNQVAFRRDGRIEAQCALNKTDFSKENPAENGMILVVDKPNNEIKLPTGAIGEVYALNYTTEHMYDERNNALKDFKLIPGTFYPRMGYLSVQDRFTTNTIVYDDSTFANEAAIKTAIKAGKLYGKVCTTEDYQGLIELVKPAESEGVVTALPETNGPLLQAVKYYDMPDGTPAIKFLVVRA